MFFLVLFLLLSPSVGAQKLFQNCDTTAGNFTANSPYKSNLDLLLSNLAADGDTTGFLNETAGRSPDQVFGLVNCRGDISATQCRSCLVTATANVRDSCSTKSAEVWYEFCLVRFSSQPLLPTSSNGQQVVLSSVDDVPKPNRFNRLLPLLLNATADAAAGSPKRFSIGEVSHFTDEFPSIYAVLQCTRDLTARQCKPCLESLFIPMPAEFVGKKGGRVLGESCSMRFELYSSFFEGSPTLRITVPPEVVIPPAAAPTSLGGGSNPTGTVLAIAIPVVSIILLIPMAYLCYRRRKRRRLLRLLYETDPEKITSVESLLFDFSILREATANFSEVNKLGEGGFGAVYKGVLPNGREIAVKRLLNSGQGLGELKNELVLVAKLQHRNLVKLLGVCLEEEKMIVYEYVPNRSLDMFLFDTDRGKELPWETRYRIICGIARGLRYLHEESQLKIIHRDLKASNVLLDADMTPKISDFGLAKLFEGDQTQGTTTRVVGTFGYMSPEYAMHGQFSIKSDAFSYGVLVLEILTGRKNSGSYNSEMAEDLLSCIWEKWNEGRALEVVDPTLGGDYKVNEVLRCIQIGLLCVQENPFDRPTMSTVVVMLNAETVSLQAPSKPAFCVGSSGMVMAMGSIYSSNNVFSFTHKKESKTVTTDVSITELGPR